jgi:hypothetical protein
MTTVAIWGEDLHKTLAWTTACFIILTRMKKADRQH